MNLVLKLLADSGLSMRQVAAALGVSKSTVSEIAMYARDAGVDWPLASTLSDDELQARLYPPPRPRSSTRQEPSYATLHQELKRPGVTLQLLWEEYRAAAGEAAYLEHGRCIAATIRSMGYPSRDLLSAWIEQVHPQGRARVGGRVAELAPEAKQSAVIALCMRPQARRRWQTMWA